MKKALITGITGQDGSYLAELLLKKNYKVYGIIRRASIFNTIRIEHIRRDLNLFYGDLTDSSNLNKLIEKIVPDEIYNLGAQSHVKVSFEVPEFTAEVDALGVLRLLDTIRETRIKTKLYQASTSELFGGYPDTIPQNEKTPFYPRSPYAAAKLYAYWVVNNYREAYDIFACNGILFNHESPRRGETFVTKKITKAVANIIKGKQDKLYLGNLNAKRDWGYAKEYIEAMWLMLQQDKPEDFVIASGKTWSIRQFVEFAFKEVNIDIKWVGSDINERGICKKTGKTLVEVNPRYFRPTEVDILLGDSTKAKKKLNWSPKTSLEELVKIMVRYDLKYDTYGGKE